MDWRVHKPGQRISNTKSTSQWLIVLFLLSTLSVCAQEGAENAASPLAAVQGREETRSGSIWHRSKPCVIEAYTIKNVSLMEYRYTMSTVMAALQHHCRCHLRLHDRSEAPEAIRNLSKYSQPTMLLIAARGVQPEERQAILDAGEHAKKLVVIHQSDEYNAHDIDWYPHVKAVFRNYHRDVQQLYNTTAYLLSSIRRRSAGGSNMFDPSSFNVRRVHGGKRDFADSVTLQGGEQEGRRLQERLQTPYSRLQRSLLSTEMHMLESDENTLSAEQAIVSSILSDSVPDTHQRRLLAEDPEATGNVFWYPLGYGDFFVPSQAMLLDLPSRPLLWSWTGSIKGKPERQEMVRQLNSSEVRKYGKLHAFLKFKGAEQLPPVTYTSLLYESMLLPLPPGMHGEQFRLWESLVAGAIPMVLKKHQDSGLAHVKHLSIKVLWINTWQEAPKVMLGVLSSPALQQELAQWQDHNIRQYARIMRAVQQQMAISICYPTSQDKPVATPGQ